MHIMACPFRWVSGRWLSCGSWTCPRLSLKKEGLETSDRRKGRDIPEFVLYSIIIFGGKFSTLFIVSLSKSQPTSQIVK